MSELAKEAAKQVVQIIPVESKQEVGKELGKASLTLARTINIALQPLEILIWGFDRIKEFLVPALEKRLGRLSPEKICTPQPNIAGPAIEALRFSAQQETIRDMFANLLATSMNVDTVNNAHPAFVEIIKQLTSDEARILKQLATKGDGLYPLIHIDLRFDNDHGGGKTRIFSNISMVGFDAHVDLPELNPSSIDNLDRLGLVDVTTESHIIKPGAYDEIESHPWTVEAIAEVDKNEGGKSDLEWGLVVLTVLGHQFLKACCTE